MSQTHSLPANVLVESFRSGEFDPSEVAEQSLKAAEQHAQLNIFRRLDAETVRDRAARSSFRYRRASTLGLLDGVVTAVKDSFDVIGYQTRHGSRTTPQEAAQYDSPAVAALRRAGAVLTGRTTMPEFGWKAVCDSPLTGVTRNPWNPERTPGGSSGGDAVALAVGAATVALGADIGGSVRIPAAFCGVVGFKPTHDRACRHPGSHAGVLSREGPMTRSVTDAALVLDAIAAVRKADPPAHQGELYRGSLQGSIENSRIALLLEHPEVEGDERVARTVEQAASVLVEMGAEIYPIGRDELDLSGLRPHYEMLLGEELLSNVKDLSEEQKELLDPGLREFTDRLSEATIWDFVEASQKRRELQHTMWSFHQDYDLLVTPTVPILPFTAGREVPEDWPEERWTSWTPFTWPFNMTGQPALTVPCGLVEGLPVGLQLVGPRRYDGLVLRAGYFLERALALEEAPGRLSA